MSGRSPEVLSGSIPEEDKVRKKGMESVPQNIHLKTKWIKMKQEDAGTFMGTHAKNNDTGFIRGMVVGFEMMGSKAGAGMDLKRISDLRFKESLENS